MIDWKRYFIIFYTLTHHSFCKINLNKFKQVENRLRSNSIIKKVYKTAKQNKCFHLYSLPLAISQAILQKLAATEMVQYLIVIELEIEF